MSQIAEQEIPIDKVKPNPWNRKTFDSKGIQELADSIKVKGVIEPLIVRKASDGKYEIASGERRWKASLLAGFPTVPCSIRDLSDEDVQDMNLIANIQREDLPALEKAAMVKARMGSNLNQTQIAKKLGKSQEWVSTLLGFLELPKEVHEHISDIPLGMAHLQAIASLPTPEYQEQLAQEIKEGKLPLDEIHQRARHLHTGFKSSQAKREKKENARLAESRNGGGVEGQRPEEAEARNGGGAKSRGRETSGPVVSPDSDSSTLASAPSTRGSAVSLASAVATALKDDVADHYLPSFGKVGGVMRSTLDKAWAAPKQHLFKWGLTLAVISWLWHPVMKTINYCFTRFMHVEVNQAINRNTVPLLGSNSAPVESSPRLTPAMLTTIAAPTGIKAELVSGHKIHLSWNPVPGVYGYNVYSAFENLDYFKETKVPTQDIEGIWTPPSGPARYRVAVTAVDAQDHESVYSQALSLDMR